MKVLTWRRTATLLVLFCSLLSPQAGRAQAQEDQATDSGWPRQIQQDGDLYPEHEGNVYSFQDGQWQRYEGNSWRPFEFHNTEPNPAQADKSLRQRAESGSKGMWNRVEAGSEGQRGNEESAGSSEGLLGRSFDGHESAESLDREAAARGLGASHWNDFRSRGGFDRGGFGEDRFSGRGFGGSSFGGFHGGGFGGFYGGSRR
jgi:hypothetical protein